MYSSAYARLHDCLLEVVKYRYQWQIAPLLVFEDPKHGLINDMEDFHYMPCKPLMQTRVP
jgi:hypothetical protein